jgi:hypothetical protein
MGANFVPGDERPGGHHVHRRMEHGESAATSQRGTPCRHPAWRNGGRRRTCLVGSLTPPVVARTVKSMQMQPGQNPPVQRHEAPGERADRNLVAPSSAPCRPDRRTDRVRVPARPGIHQPVPAAQRLPAGHLGTYVITLLLLTVVPSAVLTTPVARHHGSFHRGAKPRIVPLSARFAQIGLVFLALALNGAVLLLMDVALIRPRPSPPPRSPRRCSPPCGSSCRGTA